MQTVPNVTHATHTNPCHPNKISICGTGQDIGRGTLLQSSKFKVQQIKPVKGLGELHVSSHKFQGTKNAKQVTKEDKCGRAEVSGSVADVISVQHKEKSIESNACASDKLAKTTTIEIIDIDS